MTKTLTYSKQYEAIRCTDKPQRFTDNQGNGLSLLVGKIKTNGEPGAMSWQFRYRFDGKQMVYTIGRYPNIELAQARKRAVKLSVMVDDNICPVTQAKALKTAEKATEENSFEAITYQWMKRFGNKWKSQKHRHMVERSFKEYPFAYNSDRECRR